MSSYNETIEKLADLEHRQWMHWSKDIANLFEQVLNALANQKFLHEHNEEKRKEFQKLIDKLWNEGMKKLINWKRYWIPYEKLDEETKNKDREWAMQSYDLVPIKCPLWQCGGVMAIVEREPPEGYVDEHQDATYSGHWQTPDLVCINCGAVYKFSGIER